VSSRARLAKLRSAAQEAFHALSGRDDAVAADMRDALGRTLLLVAGVLESGRVTAPALEAFAAGCRHAIDRLTVHATRVQLESLDAAVENVLAATSAAERRALHVVVTGDHQARVRSLPMQYFQKRFAEPPGEENRVIFAEGARSVDEALALLATCRLDRKVAAAFFGDAKRLQRDVLGDAAAALLKDTPLGPIDAR
jgi:hypothetical protein